MSDFAYQGAQDQSSAATLYSSLVFLIHQELAKLSTSIPVKVTRAPYDKDGNALTPGAAVPIGFVDVQPMVNQLDGYGNATPHGTVHRLSYHRPQSGNGSVIADPVVGDVGKMIVADRDTSSVRATGKVSNPGSRRKFDKADGTYVGSQQGPYDKDGNPVAPAQWLTFNDGKSMTWHDQSANTIVTDDTGVTITDKWGNVIKMASGLIKITGNVEITGTLKVDGATTVGDISITGTESGGGPA